MRRRKAAIHDPDYEMVHLLFDRAARLRFHNLRHRFGRVDFSENHVRPFCVPLTARPSKQRVQNPQ